MWKPKFKNNDIIISNITLQRARIISVKLEKPEGYIYVYEGSQYETSAYADLVERIFRLNLKSLLFKL